MPDSGFRFDYLASRSGCNMAIRHIETLHGIIKEFESQNNLADQLNELLKEKAIAQDQVLPILNSLLVDKYAYSYVSYNLERNIEDFTRITQAVQQWDAFDMVAVYFHPELGVLPINPKRKSDWEAAQWLQRHELLTLFVGELAETGTKDELYGECIRKFVDILSGNGKIDFPSSFRIGKYPYIERVQAKPKSEPAKKKSAQNNHSAPGIPAESVPKKTKKKSSQPSYRELEEAYEASQPVSTVKKMSKMYGITVTNELFHNGNVEAWKRIIKSYEYKYPDSQVVVYYDNEKINDINSLFVWGKVKRGRVILISVMGNEIKDMAKLRRYLEDGAGINFHRFIKGNPNMILRLF